jgi:hypothetical protein
MFGSEQCTFAKFQKLPMYAETTHHHLGKEEKKPTLLILLTIILVEREAACFVLWFMKGGEKETLSLAVWVLLKNSWI